MYIDLSQVASYV